ncbi:hypothetical protein I4U23_022993 [Adineta vaga]|nr:hypothetical protein I4U23_022993 [Adineta vaga]
MSNVTFINLPTEILHRIFDYLDSQTALRSIPLVCKRFNAAINSYDRVRVDLTTISQSHLRFVSRFIRPEYVTAIIASDKDEQTSDNIDLFFSIFEITQFTRLHSLTLDQIKETNLERFLEHFATDSLVSLTVDSYKLNYSSTNASNSPVNHVVTILSKFFAQYNRLQKFHLENHNYHITEISWPVHCTLSYLSIRECSYDIYFLILRRLSQLQTLIIQFAASKYIYTKPSLSLTNECYPQLTSLTISNCRYSIEEFQLVLSSTPSLVYLKLGSCLSRFDSIFDGYFWEELIQTKLPSLNKFKFCFKIISPLQEKQAPSLSSIIKTFQSPFWLDHKRWLVTCDFTMKKRFGVSEIRLYTNVDENDDVETVFRCEISSTSNIRLLTRRWTNETSKMIIAEMSLELLANELLLLLFEYLNGIYLFRAFYNLNSRFDTLLIEYFRKHSFDFHFVSKQEFDLTCQQYLPLITHQIVALYLANTDETPCQIDLFLTDDFILRRFIHLRSLSFHSVCSNELLTKIISQCGHLHHLTHCRFIECYFENYNKSHYDTIKCLWSLPKLTHCVLDFRFMHNNHIFIPIRISESIRCVSIPHVKWQWNEFFELLRSTPNIHRLDVCLPDIIVDKQLKSSIQYITALQLFVSDNSRAMFNLLQNTPNLLCLIVKTANVVINGHQWKELIVDYLPKLKIFGFFMSYKSIDCNDIEKTIDTLFDSYRTPFWIEDHQWFVRCQWTPDNVKSEIFLYTLPEHSDYFVIQPSSYTTRTKSTCPSEYDYLPSLIHFAFARTYMYFSYIRHLHLTLPFTDFILSNLPQFDRLMILEVGCFPLIDANLAVHQLQKLIDRAPHLYSLEILAWFPLFVQEIPLNLISRSIRPLHFQNACCSINNITTSFNTYKCSVLMNSPLGLQCEFLSLIIDKRTNIIDLVDGLPNLRTLKVHCQDDQWENRSTLFPIDDELIIWLRARLPCVIINRDARFMKYIRLWIR